MLVALDKNNHANIAWLSSKKDYNNKKINYYCPNCNDKVILKKGNINIHHFSHKSNSNCSYGTGESYDHMESKKLLYEFLLNKKLDIKFKYPRYDFYFDSVNMEHKIRNRIADICIEGMAVKDSGYWLELAFEIQLSPISLEDYVKRTLDYNKNVIWFFGEAYFSYKTKGKGKFIYLGNTLKSILSIGDFSEKYCKYCHTINGFSDCCDDYWENYVNNIESYLYEFPISEIIEVGKRHYFYYNRIVGKSFYHINTDKNIIEKITIGQPKWSSNGDICSNTYFYKKKWLIDFKTKSFNKTQTLKTILNDDITFS